jgi:hypothetical protein
MTNHVPVRPVWMCAGCGADWPCATRRAELAAEFADAPVSLTLYLGGCLVTAARDLPLTRAGKLHYQFLGWTRSRVG